MKLVSVVIPCYNQGLYIEECIESVINQTYKNIEIIIVNDGSTDSHTIDTLNKIKRVYPSIKIISINNLGLSGARNEGIKNSKGYYILPLDGDDKIDITYVERCINIFNENKDVDIVYSIAEFFGTKKGIFGLRDFSIKSMLQNNCVYCTAMYRRLDYDKTPGYSMDMKYGLEDWDFWLYMIENNKKFYRINKVLFYYRRKDTSMINKLIQEKEKNYMMRQLIYNKHKKLYDSYNIDINKEQSIVDKVISKIITLKQKVKLRFLSYI